MRLRRGIGIAMLSLLGAGAAAEPALPDKLRKELIGWAAHFAERPNPPDGEQPEFVPLSDAQFEPAVCADSPFECRAVLAAYDAAGSRVLYRSRLNMDDALDRSFIVHELVHWLQHRHANVQPPTETCQVRRRAEVEAYAVQNRYLKHYQRGRFVGEALAAMVCPPP